MTDHHRHRPAPRPSIGLRLFVLALLVAPVTGAELRYPPGVTTDAQKEAWRIGWPNFHGWTSEAHTVPSSKQAFHGIRGGYASPVLAAGWVYFFHACMPGQRRPWPKSGR